MSHRAHNRRGITFLVGIPVTLGFDKSHIHQANSAHRLVTEATYLL